MNMLILEVFLATQQRVVVMEKGWGECRRKGVVKARRWGISLEGRVVVSMYIYIYNVDPPNQNRPTTSGFLCAIYK